MSESGFGVTSLVVHAALTKPEILGAIAAVTGSSIVDAGTPAARVPLGDGAEATVDVPKFGEDTPLAIDVHATDPIVATKLRGALEASGLTITVVGEPD